MELIKKSGIEYFSFIENEKVIAGITTRNAGFSEGVFNSLNLGINTKDSTVNVCKNRDLAFKTIAPEMNIIGLKQIHSNIIHFVNSYDNLIPEGDGIISKSKNLLLCISLADCGSVIFYDNEYSIIANIHCGWRGAKEGIIEKTCKFLFDFQKAESFNAIICPMIQSENYCVGNVFENYFPENFFYKQNGNLHFKLNEYIESELRRQGIRNISNTKTDTFANKHRFYSFRRDGETGRMCSFIGLKD